MRSRWVGLVLVRFVLERLSVQLGYGGYLVNGGLVVECLPHGRGGGAVGIGDLGREEGRGRAARPGRSTRGRRG